MLSRQFYIGNSLVCMHAYTQKQYSTGTSWDTATGRAHMQSCQGIQDSVGYLSSYLEYKSAWLLSYQKSFLLFFQEVAIKTEAPSTSQH